MTVLIRCPWPARELSPNARCHHMVKHRAVKAYRHTCWGLAMEQSAHLRQWPAEGKITLKLTFHPPTANYPDDDNTEASFKAGRDGIAQAMGVDDARFEVTRAMGDKVKGGCVMVEVQA